MLEINKIYCGDCLEVMKNIPDKFIDMILCDLPYGMTSRNKWDVLLPLNKLWDYYDKIIKDNGVILLFSQGIFTAKVMLSNESIFRYKLMWDKDKSSGFLNSNKMPLKQYEEICVFYKNQPMYNPLFINAKKSRIRPKVINGGKNKSKIYGELANVRHSNNYDNTKRFPTDIIKISCIEKECNFGKRLHPTQKPISLFKYLINTYTHEGDLVLDNCIGSGTTAIACKETNRNFIGIEKEQKYVDIANKRLKQKTVGDFFNKSLSK